MPELFNRMSVKPDEVATLLLFNACAKLTDANTITTARGVLKRMSSTFLAHDRLVTAAIDMLMKFGQVAQAEHLFETLKSKNIVSHGALMHGN